VLINCSAGNSQLQRPLIYHQLNFASGEPAYVSAGWLHLIRRERRSHWRPDHRFGSFRVWPCAYSFFHL